MGIEIKKKNKKKSTTMLQFRETGLENPRFEKIRWIENAKSTLKKVKYGF